LIILDVLELNKVLDEHKNELAEFMTEKFKKYKKGVKLNIILN
jgi:hypothetical protein